MISDEYPVIREKDSCQWFMFHCPSCEKEVWVYYGDKNDLSCADADGYVCCYCETKVIYKFNADSIGAVFDSLHDRNDADRIKYIEKRSMLDDSEVSCPITEEENEYDPEEMKRLWDGVRKLLDKSAKGELTHDELVEALARLE